MVSLTNYIKEAILNWNTQMANELEYPQDPEIGDSITLDDGSKQTYDGEKYTKSPKYIITSISKLPLLGVRNKDVFVVSSFYEGGNCGGGLYSYDPNRSWNDHDGFTVIALGSLSLWNGSEETVMEFLDWTGNGNGCFVLTSTKTLLASNFIEDPTSAGSVYKGLKRLNKQVIKGSVIYIDIAIVAPSSQIKIVKDNVTVMGSSIFRNDFATEYPFWVGDTYTSVNGVSFVGLTIEGNSEQPFEWGKQGVYIKRATNTAFINCRFKKIGDAAIRLASSVPDGTAEGALESRTDGVQIIGCLFEDCTQITTNNTGAHSIVFSGCIFRRVYSTKFTQRNLVRCRTSKIIGCIFDDVRRIVEVQGGGNVEIISCHGTAEQLLTAYSNSSSFVSGEHIPYGNIKFTDCNFTLSCPSDTAIYLETTDGPNNNKVDNYGFITLYGCVLTSTNSQAKLLRMFRNISVDKSMHPSVLVEKCKLKNFVGTSLLDVDNNVLDDWYVGLIDNDWDEVQTVIAANLRETGKWTIDIRKNRGNVQRYVHSLTQTNMGENFIFEDNKLKCTSNDGNGFSFLNLQSQAYGFIARNISNQDNVIDLTDNWRPVTLNLAQPKFSNCTLSMGNNKIILPKVGTTRELTLTRPLYVSSQEGIGWEDALMCYPSFVLGSEGRKIRAEGGSGLGFGALELEFMWLSQESRSRLLQRYFSGDKGSTWRVLNIYSDGVVKSYGRSKNSSSNDFNTYFPFASDKVLDEPYAPAITPEEDCRTYLLQDVAGGFTARFVNSEGAEISPWFRYNVEYKVDINELANYIGGQ